MTPGLTLAASLGAALVLGAAVAGWLAPGAPQTAALSIVRHGGGSADAVSLARPGTGLTSDVDALAVDLAVPPPTLPHPPAPPPRPIGMTPAPVMHDVGPVFRARASAIVRLPNGRLAVLLAAGPGEARSRLLHVGESFDDRWRLASLTMNEAVIDDGTTLERVPLFGEALGAPGGEPQ